MKRIIALFLSLSLCFSLVSCKKSSSADSSENDNLIHYGSYELLRDVLGYDMYTFEAEGRNLTDCAIQSSSIGVLTYAEEKQTITLKMTLDEAENQILSTLTEETRQQGTIGTPSNDFGPLNVYQDENGLCFCPFTYTCQGYTCYLYLSETDTSMNHGFSELLMDFVAQIYMSEETPAYVTYLDNIAKAQAAAEKARQEAENPQPAKTPKEEKPTEEKPAESEPEQTAEEQTEETLQEETPQEETPKEEKPTEEKLPEATGGITLTYYDITLVNIGDAYTFDPTGGKAPYAWKSANTAVASVTEGGTVKAVGSGETTVSCTSSDGLSVNVIVRVK